MCAMMENDDRQHQRIELALVATVTGLSQSAPRKNTYLLTRNLCGSGAFFLADERPKMNAPLSTEWSLPSHGLRLRLNGVNFYGKMGAHVVRHDKDGFAVAFEDKYHIDFWSQAST